jgi:hypothetical protein
MLNNFQIYHNNAWVNVNPIFNDFKIKRVRDSLQIFQVRTIADATLNFYCADFDILKDYAGLNLDLKFDEEICGNVYNFEAILNVNNEIDYYLKKVTASVILKDAYYGLIEKPTGSLEFAQDRNLQTVASTDLPFFNTDFLLSIKRTWRVSTTISRLVSFINDNYLYEFAAFNTSQVPEILLDIDRFVFARENVVTEINGDSISRQEINSREVNISLQTLFDILRERFFIGWFVRRNDGSNPFLPINLYEFFVDLRRLNDKSAFYINETISENNFEKRIAIENDNENSLINFKTFDFFSETDLNINRKYFATPSLTFDVAKANIKEINTQAETYIPEIKKDGGKNLFFDVTFDDNFELTNLSKEFENIDGYAPFDYQEGDADSLILNTTTTGQKRIFYKFPTNFMSQGSLRVRVFMSQSVANMFIVFGNRANVAQQTKFAISTGNNTFNFSGALGDLWLEKTGTFTNTTFIFSEIYYISTPFTRFKVFNFNLSISPYRIIKEFGAEMPRETGQYQVSTIDETMTFEKKNNKVQEIIYNFNENIENIDFDGLIQTSLGVFQIDELERNYSNDYYSHCKLKLTNA